ncbi:hypothetical protein BH09MYX1_BH09MYX1_63440 [soil metagenome]
MQLAVLLRHAGQHDGRVHDQRDFQNWTVGESKTGIPFDVNQNGVDVSGKISGWIGGFLNFIAGTDTLIGTVSANVFTMKILSKEATDAGCTSKVQIKADGKLVGDAVDGTLTYSYIIISGGAACSTKSTCTSVQTFNGTRPPK